jgi:hypothetical protein
MTKKAALEKTARGVLPAFGYGGLAGGVLGASAGALGGIGAYLLRRKKNMSEEERDKLFSKNLNRGILLGGGAGAGLGSLGLGTAAIVKS